MPQGTGEADHALPGQASSPWLSIVMPARNEADNIVATLVPLQVWRQRGVEVILVDGGSDDATAELAAPLVDRVLDATAGRALQMNAGASSASAPMLLFLHADTCLSDEGFNQLRQYSASTVWGRFDIRLHGDSHWLPLVSRMMNLRSRLSGIATGDQGMFMHRALFELVGGFPDQPLMEDVELSSRLRRLCNPLCLRACITSSGRRWDRHGAWKTILLMWQLRLRYALGADPVILHRRYYA